jgi:hypothetical protein
LIVRQWSTQKKLVRGLGEKLCRMRLNVAEQRGRAETCRVADDHRLMILRGPPPSLYELTRKDDINVSLAAVGAIDQSEVAHGCVTHIEEDWRRQVDKFLWHRTFLGQ